MIQVSTLAVVVIGGCTIYKWNIINKAYYLIPFVVKNAVLGVWMFVYMEI